MRLDYQARRALFLSKSKSYLINNQELAPFSLDNLRMVFHIVCSTHESGKTALLKKKTYHSFRLSEIFYGLNPNTKGNAERRKHNISDPSNFPCESTERQHGSWCCLFH